MKIQIQTVATRVVWNLPKGNFFFQAEDGIRGADVTGVQTCALPILPTLFQVHGIDLGRAALHGVDRDRQAPLACLGDLTVEHSIASEVRSEERRVGKEREST